MDNIGGIPFTMLAFDKNGDVRRTGDLFPQAITDLIIVSHGWKNSEQDAKTLYQGFIEGALAAGGGSLGANRNVAVLGISWPSFRFRPDLSLLPDDFGGADGGAAAAGDADLSGVKLRAYAAEIAEALGMDDPEQFSALADKAHRSDQAADTMVDQLKRAVRPEEEGGDATADHAPLFKEKGSELVENAKLPPPAPAAPPQEDDEGGASSLLSDARKTLGNWLSGGRAAVARTLNQFTYYEMKARAGLVGEALARILNSEPGLKEEAGKTPPRIHYVGHSFGARLVTAAANSTDSKIASLTLLQGAFSHNGFRDTGPEGAFRAVRTKVEGPILVTHTHNDTAVGFYYAVASFASGETAKDVAGFVARFIGGPNDPHGGLGANGAQGLVAPGVTWLKGKLGEVPAAIRGSITNICGDGFIRDHNDVGADRAGPIIWAAIKS